MSGDYGGEEFIVIMPETPPEGALMIAERIRQMIEVTPFPGKPAAPATSSGRIASRRLPRHRRKLGAQNDQYRRGDIPARCQPM